MKVIVRYQCEICNGRYEEEDSALACENKGLAEEYPIGCLWGNHKPEAFYTNITFAVAGNSIGPGHHGHLNCGASWACRDNGSGDSLGDQRCGSGTLKLTDWDAHLDPEHPTFKRMVDWLESQDIPVTVWNGKKAIPLEEYLLWST